MVLTSRRVDADTNIRRAMLEDTASYPDPPVDCPPGITRDGLVELVEKAKENYRKRETIRLQEDLNIIQISCAGNHHWWIADVVKDTGVVPFVLRTTAQRDDIRMLYFGVRLLATLTSDHDFAIDECIDHDSFYFVRQLLIHPVDQIGDCGKVIMSNFMRTERGAKMCYESGVLKWMCTKFGESNNRTQRLDLVVARGITNCGPFVKLFVRDDRLLLLRKYGMVAKESDELFAGALDFVWAIVETMKDDGIIDVMESNIVVNMVNELFRRNDDSIVGMVCVVSLMMATTNQSLRLKVANIMNFETLLSAFMATTSTKVFGFTTRLMINISATVQVFEWFFEEKVQARVFEVLTDGCARDKCEIMKIVCLVLGLGSIEDVRRMLVTDIPIVAVDVLHASSSDDLIVGLRAIGRAMGIVHRHGLRGYDKFNAFQDRLVELLQESAGSDNTDVVRISRTILESNFPEIYFA